MSATISVETFTREMLIILGETFESVQGVYLDKGTSLLETLATVSAEEASIPVGQGCASIAAQVSHVCFYLDVVERYLKTGKNEPADWGEVWRTVRAVTPVEWAALQARLAVAYQTTRQGILDYQDWEGQYAIAGAVGMLAHCAYHLGEIRQALCTVKQR
jgi:hypothetical protein